MIEEFEKGFQSGVQLNENTQGGTLSFTAEVQVEPEATSTKRQKIERWITPSSAGYITASSIKLCVINSNNYDHYHLEF